MNSGALRKRKLKQKERGRFVNLIGDIGRFAPRVAQARKTTGEPNASEVEAARKVLERVRDTGTFTVDTQEVIAKALSIDPNSLLEQILDPEPAAKNPEEKKSPARTQARNPAPEPSQPLLAKPSAKARRGYLEKVIDECAPLKLKAIDQNAVKPGSKPLGLTSVYVDLNLDWRIPEGIPLAKYLARPPRPENDLDPKTVEQEKKTRLVPVLEAFAQHEKLVILGAPGSGKSTLAAYVALSLAEAGTGNAKSLARLGPDWKFGALLPVLVVLRQFAAGLPKDLDRGRASHLWDFIENDLLKRGFAPALAMVPRQAAQHGGALFLLDGLDETRDEAARARVLEAVAEFARTSGRHCRFLLTARPYAWEDFKNPQLSPAGSTPGELAEMHTAHKLAEFEPGQIETFITHWYQAVQAAGWPVSDPARKVEELRQSVQREDLKPLARNPLLLTLMATLHSNRTRLPEDRADLYNEVVELLLQRWNEQVGADRGLLDALDIPTLTLSHVRKVIQGLAFEVHAANVGQEGVPDIPEGTLLNRLRPLLANDTAKADLALRYIENRAGLLISQGEKSLQRQYTFPHRTFQEFLAACHLAGRNDFSQTATQLARENPAHWREVLTLAARRAESDRGVPVADALVHRLSYGEGSRNQSASEVDWRAAVLAAEQLLEIGLAVVQGDEGHRVVQCRVAGWLAALLENGALPVKERARAGMVLAKLGDPRKGVGVKDGLPDIDWIEIPKGEFTMGGTGDRHGKRVFQCGLIREPYRISRYPVTVAQFEAFVSGGGYQEQKYWTKAGWEWRHGLEKTGPTNYGPVFQTANHPQVGVTWYEAVAFCRWLGETVKLDVRLPSEAEWERAARGPNGRSYPWGEEKDFAERCNMKDSGLGHTSAVGMFPSGFAECGAADLAGNVWEWCRTPWVESYKEYEKNDLILKEDLERSGWRVVRGACWGNDSGDIMLSSCRDDLRPGDRYSGFGFRVVVVGVSAR